MAKLEFETLEFEEENGFIDAAFLKLFGFRLSRDKLESIGELKVGKNWLEFKGVSKEDAESRLSIILAEGFADLRNKVNGKQTVYIHRNSGIPLIGNLAFGITDRNTNIIEVKPITVCNLKCIYCSVDADKRPVDFVVEKEYIVEEIKKIIKYKGESGIEIHIGGQAEPLYYADLAPLVKDLSAIKEVSEISIDTNCTMLSKKKIDELVKAGMTRFNLSINAFEPELASQIAGAPYSLKNVLEAAEYTSGKADVIIAPVWIPGINDDEMPRLIEFSKKLMKKSKHRVIIGIQNFLNYRFGRKAAKQVSWEKFRKRLEKLEKEHNARLILDFKKDFSIKPTKPLPKPFKKGQKIDAVIMCDGRIAGEKIAVAEGRSITLPNCSKTGSVKVKITRTKHNIYYGSCI